MNDPSDPPNPPTSAHLDDMGSVAGTPSKDAWQTDSLGASAKHNDPSTAATPAPPNAPHPHLATPETDRYVKTAVLGIGGMGRVWSVHDRRLRRVVALKELSPAVSGCAEMHRRLADEALITAQLEHPGIVPVYDAGQGADGALYYAMRLVRGRSLHALIEATPSFTKRLALVRHFRDAVEAIAYAHSMDIIHRDLKPQNVMVGEFGETQVVDWGLARPIRPPPVSGTAERLTPQSHDPLPPDEASLTLAGQIVGTPQFMSPEQARGLPATKQSDIWGLGAILYVLLTRTTPLQGDSQALLAALREQVSIRPARALEPMVPPELAKIAERALQPRPEDRYPSARALGEDVSAWLEGRRVGAYDYSRWELLKRFARAWRGPLIVGVIAFFLLTTTGIVSYLRVVDEQRLTAQAEQKTRASLALADQNLAHALIEQALTIAPLGARPEAETLAAHALALQESPEARGLLARFSVSERLQRIEHISPPACISRSLSSQGQALLCIEDGALSLWNLSPLAQRWRQPLNVLHAAMLDDVGRVFVQLSPFVDAVLDASSGALLAQHTRTKGMPKGFLMFSRYVAVLGQPRRALIYDGATAERLERVICASDLFEAAVAIAPSGDTLAVFCNETQTLHLGPLRGELTAVALPRDGGLSVLQFSSTGALLACGNTRGDVVLIDIATKKVIRHTQAGVGVISRLAFSNSDKQVVIAGERGGILLWDVLSGAHIGHFPRSAGREFSVSSDGFFVVTLGQSVQRWALPRDTRPHTFSSDEDAMVGLASASLSPDERLLVGNRGDGALSIFSIEDGARVHLSTGTQAPIKYGTFSLDSALYYPISASVPVPVVETQTWYPVPSQTSPPGRLIEMLEGDMLAQIGYSAPLSDIKNIEQHHRTATNPNAQKRITFTKSLIDIGADQKKHFAALLEEHAPQRVLRFTAGELPTVEPLFEVSHASAVDISSDGQTFAVVRLQELLILDVPAPLLSPQATESAIRLRLRAPAPLLDVAFSPDNRRVAASDMEGNLWLWSTDTGHLLAVLRGHTLRVPWLQFDAAGASIFSASWDGTLRRWNIQNVQTPAPELLDEITRAWGLSLSQVIDRAGP